MRASRLHLCFRLLVVAAAAGAIAGCSLPPVFALVSYAADGVSYAASGKSLADHAISSGADRDCALYRVFVGDDICRDFAVRRGPPGPVLVASVATPYDIHGTLLDEPGEAFYVLDHRDTRLTVSARKLGASRARIHLGRNEDLFAVMRSDGSLEIYAGEPRTRRHSRMVIRITGYAVEPGSFTALDVGDEVHLVEELVAAG